MLPQNDRDFWTETLAPLGANFGTVEGLSTPLDYGNWRQEWAAVRERTGAFDGRLRKLWALVGGDRLSFLQGMITADVSSVPVGGGTYGAAVTVQGRVVSDLRVYVLEDELWLDVPVWRAQRLREHLERHIVADDVEFREPKWVPLTVLEGREAPTLIAEWLGSDVSTLPLYGHREVSIGGYGYRVCAVTHTGEKGWIFFGAADSFPPLWQQALERGAQPVGWLALDVLRVEAGLPLAGRDMDESTLIAEAEIEWAISYGKGCYVGQEVVERVAARGQVQRRRRGFVCRGATVPEPGARLFMNDREVGTVTSVAWSPALECGIGFAYVRREAWEFGSPLEARWQQGKATVELTRLPFLQLPVDLW
ncbi:Aminomethyltransferase [bacterium HR30]|nr:Aminomethyltransferase [bacterium HR30]